jgi:FG-GAP-like repeat
MKRLITTICFILVVAATALPQCNSSCTLDPPGIRYPLFDWRFINNGSLSQTYGYYMTEDIISIKVEDGADLELTPNEIEIVLTNVPDISWRKEIVAFNACSGRGATIATQGSNDGPVRMRITRNGNTCSADTVILRKEKFLQGMVDMYHMDPNRFWRLWAGKIVTFNWSSDWYSGSPPVCNFPCVPVTTNPNAGILYDTDSKADIAVFRQSFPSNTADWFVVNSSTGISFRKRLGKPNDLPVPYDYDGDGRTDMAVWRPATGEWFVINSLTGQTRRVQWGTLGDMPAPGDYDGDGKADLAVWRASASTWFIQSYITGAVSTVSGGTTQDIQVAGDYDGDRITDPAVWNIFNGTWNIFGSHPRTEQLGTVNDIAVPADYDGDGKTDISVWRPGEWLIRNASGTDIPIQWGVWQDQPVPGDYDGDGKADVAIWRSWTSEWWIRKSSDTSTTIVVFGGQGDIPVPSK